MEAAVDIKHLPYMIPNPQVLTTINLVQQRSSQVVL